MCAVALGVGDGFNSFLRNHCALSPTIYIVCGTRCSAIMKSEYFHSRLCQILSFSSIRLLVTNENRLSQYAAGVFSDSGNLPKSFFFLKLSSLLLNNLKLSSMMYGSTLIFLGSLSLTMANTSFSPVVSLNGPN